MRVTNESCMGCDAKRVTCWWTVVGPLRLCLECYRDKFNFDPPTPA